MLPEETIYIADRGNLKRYTKIGDGPKRFYRTLDKVLSNPKKVLSNPLFTPEKGSIETQ